LTSFRSMPILPCSMATYGPKTIVSQLLWCYIFVSLKKIHNCISKNRLCNAKITYNNILFNAVFSDSDPLEWSQEIR
jgi:hypothetical protein